MKQNKNIVFTICLVLFALPSFCQKYYDAGGHLLAHQEGKDIYDSLNKKLESVPVELSVTETKFGTDGERDCYYFFDPLYKYSKNMEYNSIHKKWDDYIYANSRIIGRILGDSVYNDIGNIIGYFKNEGSYESSGAVIFYFLLLPNWGGYIR